MDLYLLSVLLAPFMCNGLLNPRAQSLLVYRLDSGSVSLHISVMLLHLFMIDLCVTHDWYAQVCRVAKFASDPCTSVSRGKV